MCAELRVIFRSAKLRSHPELRADGGLASGRAHLEGLISISAANALEEVVDEVKPAESADGGMSHRRALRAKRKRACRAHLLSLRMNKMSSLKVSLFFSRIPRTS